jgi:hypothetical protein
MSHRASPRKTRAASGGALAGRSLTQKPHAREALPAVKLPDVDAYGRPFTPNGLASLSARLQISAREELRRAGAALGNQPAQEDARLLMDAADALVVNGPFLHPSGRRREDAAEVLQLTAGAARAIALMREAPALPAPADEHLKRALALCAAACGVRETAIHHPAAVDAAADPNRGVRAEAVR